MQTATPLPSIEALTAPPDSSDCHPHYGYLGFLRGVVEDQGARETLLSHAFKVKPGRLQDALLSGAGALYTSVLDDARKATERGHLLLCWPGTTVLKGVAS